MTESNRRLILASASRTRADLLHSAAVTFDVMPADVDEATIKQVALTSGADIDARDIAVLLATAKAVTVSERYPGVMVIGADQTLLFGDLLLDKPADRASARDQLVLLRGKTHTLDTAVACAINGEMVWATTNQAHLTMRMFSDHALETYLVAAGDEVTSSVGGYRIEGPAIQLFERIDGDYFAILGLPLLPLLDFLRARGMLAT